MASKPLRVVFAGTPEFAATHLGALLASEHEVIAVYTQPDRPAGRGKKLTASPVKLSAQAAGLPVYQPATLRSVPAQQQLAELNADVMIVVAYGLILPQEVLAAPRLGALNVHASLLPRWRGAAPIQRAILAGDSETGITIMQMDAGLDTGDMLAVTRCKITDTSTAASLSTQLAQLGPPTLLRVLDALPAHQAEAQAQDTSAATYAEKITKSEAQLDWRGDANALAREVRAFNPFPICFGHLAGERLKIWAAQAEPRSESTVSPGTITAVGADGIAVACGTGQLRLQRVQFPGGKALPVTQLLNARGKLFALGGRFTAAGPDSH